MLKTLVMSITMADLTLTTILYFISVYSSFAFKARLAAIEAGFTGFYVVVEYAGHLFQQLIEKSTLYFADLVKPYIAVLDNQVLSILHHLYVEQLIQGFTLYHIVELVNFPSHLEENIELLVAQHQRIARIYEEVMVLR